MSSVLVTVSSIVRFDVPVEIIHGAFFPGSVVTHGRAVYRGKRAVLPRQIGHV